MSTPWTVGKSVGVIALLEYLGPMIAQMVANVSSQYAILVARSIVLYLELAAYNQGLISVPTNLLISA